MSTTQIATVDVYEAGENTKSVTFDTVKEAREYSNGLNAMQDPDLMAFVNLA